MAGGVTGDFGDLADLRQKLARLGSPSHRLDMSKNLAEEARTQVAIGFQRGVDPYDQPWKPLRSRDGQPLRDTGRLMNSVAGAHLNVRLDGFTIRTGVKYAATHQYGATIRAKNARYRFGGVGPGQDMVTGGAPMLTFKVGGPRGKARWVSKAQVTIPRRQFMPEGHVGSRWRVALEKVADLVLHRFFGGA